jgi:cytochrome c-type biogenesis protein
VFDIPIAYAFFAGMVATINPCGFVMLPAYMAYHMGLADDSRSIFSRVISGTFMGLMATVGFVALFGTVGLLITGGGWVVIKFFPYWGLSVGVGVLLLGLFLLVSRRHLGVTSLSRVAGPKTIRGSWGFFLFGVAYALVSLSCTLPIFLVVVGGALAAKGFLSGIVQFVSYGVGMGTVLIGVTLSVVFFKTAVTQASRAVMPYVERIGALALVATGSYLVYYWTLGSGGELLFR